MKGRNCVLTTLSAVLLCAASLPAQDSGAPQRAGIVTVDDFAKVKNPMNPKPFQNNMAPLSGFVNFLLSEKGKGVAQSSNHPNLRGFFRRMGINPGSAPPSSAAHPRGAAAARQFSGGGESRPCNVQTGAQFNLEPATGMPEIGFPVPQNETPVDFIPGGGIGGADLILGGANDYRGMLDNQSNGFGGQLPNAWGLSVTGYYVHVAGNDCGASFEGGLPHLTATSGETLYGFGDPVPAVDSVRGNVFFTDLRLGFTTGVGLFRTNFANMINPAICPLGTHLTDASGVETTSLKCWPVGLLVSENSNPFQSVDKPHMRADERSSGIGAGDVYVTNTLFDFLAGTSVIQLTSCKGNFMTIADCSSPIVISGPDLNTQFSHIAVRTDGIISITYVNTVTTFNSNAVPFFVTSADIKYVSCKPAGAPLPPTCSQPSLILSDPQPIPGLTVTENFRISTYPTHDFRSRAGHLEEFVVWSRCKTSPFVPIGAGHFSEQVECADADVLLASSPTDSSGTPLGWSQPSAVNVNPGDQFFSWVKSNHEQNTVNVTYYSAENDSFHHRLQVMLSQIHPGEDDVDENTQLVTQVLNDPDVDAVLGAVFFGDYIGLASKGGTTYVHTTANTPGIFGGITVPGQNNVLSRSRRGEEGH